MCHPSLLDAEGHIQLVQHAYWFRTRDLAIYLTLLLQ